jgi:23S rRNA (cytidine2498-2'-O)-methyltransferase
MYVLSMKPKFYFSICHYGAEKIVKEEVLASNPGLRFAFSRPGFVSFKDADPRGPEIRNPGSLFTRLWGVGLGQASGIDDSVALLGRIPAGSLVQGFERSTFLPGDEPEGFRKGARIRSLLEELQGRLPEPLRFNERIPVTGETVYDLIWIEEGRLFLGRHSFEEGLDPSPGNDPDLLLPEESPSRAYLKIEEAIHRFRPPVRAGLSVLEVGCSPGGATTAMLRRGLRVTGVDPKRMAPAVEAHEAFRLIRKPASRVIPADLLGVNPEWIVMDMNLAPLEALDELNHLTRLLRSIHGNRLRIARGFLTVKLNDWTFASSVPLYLKRISELGFDELAAVQLCSNRQEFFVHARGFR